MLSPQEMDKFKSKYDRNRITYENVSKHIVDRCIQHKITHPKQVRVVFSRDPVIKTWESLAKKIEDKRKNKKSRYGYDDLEDLIALTVLCPYKSDVREFIEWMKISFTILTSDKDAIRTDQRGHRGYHYIVEVHKDVLKSFSNYRDVKCEIQIKTILEEAFDAKSHDLTYKPGVRHVPDELKNQFGALSSHLGLVDEQSEFLRDSLLSQEKETDLRRKACTRLYVADKETMSLLGSLSIELDESRIEDVGTITEKLKKASEDSGRLLTVCKCAVLCATALNNDFLKDEAINYCKRIEASGKDGKTSLIVASIRWVLGDFEDAIESADRGLKRAQKAKNTALIMQAKNDFLYYVIDWKAFREPENNALANHTKAWAKRAKTYVNELSKNSTISAKDTIGFYWIIFGSSPEEVDRGRGLIREARGKNPDNSDFFRYHEHIALKQLLAMLKASA